MWEEEVGHWTDTLFLSSSLSSIYVSSTFPLISAPFIHLRISFFIISSRSSSLRGQRIISHWPVGPHITLHALHPTPLLFPLGSNLILSHTGYTVWREKKSCVWVCVTRREVFLFFFLTVCSVCCWGHKDPRPSTASWCWEPGDHRRCMLASGCCRWGKDWTGLPLLSRGSVGELGKRRASK